MTRSLWLLVAPLTLTAALAIACGGGGGGDHPQSTASPEGFVQARDELVDELDSIGANIGVVPDDVRDFLLDLCRDLEPYVDQERLDNICDAINQAIEEDDPGLIVLVLNELAVLTPD